MKFFYYTALFFLIIFWISGCYPEIVSRLSFVPDDYRYGDLYRLSHLPQFKEQPPLCRKPIPPRKSREKKVNLYIIGDSFTEEKRVNLQDFGVDQYVYVHWDNEMHVKLDTAATNIVILQTVERHFREHFADGTLMQLIPDSESYISQRKPKIMAQIDRLFDGEKTDDWLKLLSINYEPILWLREMKASFEFDFFKRTAPTVTVSDDGEHIVYFLDTDSTQLNSSFIPIDRSAIDSLVEHVNRKGHVLKKMGFDKVFLSIIPNKATIVMPYYGRYNHLIERVYSHPSLAVPAIDLLNEYRKMGPSSYLKGDSHWSCQGQQLWLSKVHALL